MKSNTEDSDMVDEEHTKPRDAKHRRHHGPVEVLLQSQLATQCTIQSHSRAEF